MVFWTLGGGDIGLGIDAVGREAEFYSLAEVQELGTKGPALQGPGLCIWQQLHLV